MSLIKCTECGADISDKAKACPKCGCPIGTNLVAVPESYEMVQAQNESTKSNKKKLWTILVILIVAITASVAWFVFSHRKTESGHSEKDSTLVVRITPEFCNAIRKYNELGEYSEGFAAVKNGDKWGFINTEGKEIIPCKYDKAKMFHGGLASVLLNGKWISVNTEGVETKDHKETTSTRKEISHYATFVVDGDVKLVGIMDKETGRRIIPAKYSYISEFHNGVALAWLSYPKISSGVTGYDEETVRIYGYVDVEGNETFTSQDFIKVRQANNDAIQEKYKLDHEAQQNPSWLQGEWYFRNSNGTCYARINGDNILVAFGQDVSYNGPYTIEDDKVIYDRHDGMYSYLPFDRNREVLMMDENNQMYRSADEANSAYRSSGSRSTSSGNYNSRDTHPFETDGDVYDFIGGSFYGPYGRRISLKHNGMYVDGVNTATTSTIVTSFSGMYARVKVMAIPNDVYTFTVNKANGTLVDMEGNVWHKR